MIILFTSNIKGGVMQLTMQLLSELSELGEKVICFIPEEAEYVINEGLENRIVCYERIKKNIELLGRKAENITEQIRSYNPEIVWFTDQVPGSLAVGMLVAKFCKTISTIHDVTCHPTNDNKLKARMYRFLLREIQKSFDKYTTYRVLLSELSREKYLSSHDDKEESTFLLPLGAHILEMTPQMPRELNVHDKSYLLFIGRIDKYKGISTLATLYQMNPQINLDLVIAGHGNIDRGEQCYFEQDNRIILINRYIQDYEFMALVQNALAVILPYMEASQSGVIPIAYKFGVPVITSNLGGLTQFVVQGETGFICDSLDDYKDVIEYLVHMDRDWIRVNCKSYYESNLEWKQNLKKLKKEIKW